MPSSRAVKVTLSDELVDMIQAKVASREYASESEVVSDGLQGLRSRDIALDHWLRDEVVASWEEHNADPSIGIYADEVSAKLDARFQARLVQTKP
jgi:Arc/MetJ-type ribon-helix-helix transcriptional regulator